MKVKILTHSVNCAALNSATPLQKMGKWRYNAKRKQRSCSVRDGVVLRERKPVFAEDKLTRNDTK
jgi:hypothetical protein